MAVTDPQPGAHPAPASLGQLVRSHRVRAGLTQRALAGRAGLSVRAVRDIESDRIRRPQPRSVAGLASALDLAGDERRALIGAGRSDGLPSAVEPRPLIGVLGPLVVRHGTAAVDVASPMQRRLLSLFALHAGEAVTVDQAIDMLWPDALSRSCRSLVQTYAVRLEVLLSPSAPVPPQEDGPARP